MTSCPVAVRIVKRSGRYLVIGRKTTEEFGSFPEVWEASIPYFAGRKH